MSETATGADPVAQPVADPAAALIALAAGLDDELATLERELAEIQILVGQSRTEATRHEQKRVQAAERIAVMESGRPAATSPGEAGPAEGGAEMVEAYAQLVTLTRRAAVMESQLDVLAGKERILERSRDMLARLRPLVATLEGGGAATPVPGHLSPDAQENLRRELARAIHDGPVQGLANLVLQAQIVDRLVGRDPEAAAAEVRELVAMVQRTLEATKTFVFDVRPMVLDDLGLVPTLRRVARDRSRRSEVTVTFVSSGPDRRLPGPLESAIFRIADEAVGAFVAGQPDAVALILDWGDALEVEVRAEMPPGPAVPEEELPDDMPPMLREMAEERRSRNAERERRAMLTTAIRRELGDRASAVGGRLEIATDGHALTVRIPLPSAAPVA